MVVEDLEARPVVSMGEPLLRDGHPYACGDSLSERAGRRLDARDPMVLGMPGRLAVKLAKAADVVERHSGLPQPLILGIPCWWLGQVEPRTEQRRGVPVRGDAALAI